MIRGTYNTQVQPPAPFVLVSLRDALGLEQSLTIPAQIDTAADRTVVPLSAVTSLGLSPIDERTFVGFGGTLQRVPLFLLSLAIHTFPASVVQVIAHPDEPWVLLGRDVLNAYRLLLDGPNLVLELE
jgi:hypothetical protein